MIKTINRTINTIKEINRLTALHFTFWISLLPWDQLDVKPDFGLSPDFRLTNFDECTSMITHWRHGWRCRISLFTFGLLKKWSDFAERSLISDRLTYITHAKSTRVQTNVGLSDRSVQTLVSVIAVWSRSLSANEKCVHFLADLQSQSEFSTQWYSQRKD